MVQTTTRRDETKSYQRSVTIRLRGTGRDDLTRVFQRQRTTANEPVGGVCYKQEKPGTINARAY